MKQKHTLQWLSAVTGRAKGLVGLLVVVQTVLSVSSIAFAFVLRRIINMAVDGARGGFWASLALLVGILLGQIVLSATGRFLSEYTSATVENRFKHRLFSALLTGDYASVAAVHSGEWMNRLTSDTTVVAGGVTQIVPGLIGMLVRLLGAVTAILWLEPRFLYILLPGGAAMMLLTYAFRKILKRLHKRIQETDGALRVFLQERLESLVIVRTFAKEEQMAQQADALMDAHKAARMKRSNFSNLCNIGFAGAMDGAYLLGIGFCGYGILTGTMSYGNLMAIMQLVGQVQSPFANLTGYLPRYYSMLASAERLMEAEAFAPDSTETVPEEQTLNFYQTELQSLQLEHVCFTYQPPVQTEGEPPAMPVVLQDVSLTVRKGEYVVFTGPSGCGKSTLLKLLMCLYPLDSGQRLDWEYVESELRSLGILDYERDSRKLSQKLFGNTKTVLRPELTEEENQMFAYYLGATTYGNLFNQTLHRMQEFQPDIEHFSGELDLDIPPPLIRRKNSNRVEYNVHFSSYVGTFSIFPFIFRQKEKSHRPSDQ